MSNSLYLSTSLSPLLATWLIYFLSKKTNNALYICQMNSSLSETLADNLRVTHIVFSLVSLVGLVGLVSLFSFLISVALVSLFSLVSSVSLVSLVGFVGLVGMVG